MPSKNVTDHLANERTFLAWLRTGISLMAFGVVIAKLRFYLVSGVAPSIHDYSSAVGTRSTILGIAFAVVGLLTLSVATAGYFRNLRMIDSASFVPLTHQIVVFASAIVVLGILTIAYLLDIWK